MRVPIATYKLLFIMIHYCAEFSFKKELSNEECLNLLIQIANNGGALSQDMYQYVEVIDVVQKMDNCDKKQNPLNESVLSRNISSERVAQIFQDNMPHQNSDKELIVIDPYFFSANEDTFSDTVIRLSKILNAYPTLSTIKIVTDSRNSRSNKSALIEVLKEMISNVTCADSSDFHDRFWLLNGERGIVVGTSLNGIGNKIFLIAPLEQDDVKVIMDEVSDLNFQSL